MDVETCFEQIWPHYGGGLTANSDATGGRTRISSSGGIRRLVADQACPYVQHVLDHSPLFRKTTNRHARLVLFDCGYHGPTPPCFSRTANPGYMDDRVSLVSLSANPRQHWSSTHDIGLLPPAVTLSHLNERQERDIEQCTTSDHGALQSDQTGTASHPRPYLLTFIGNFRHSVRQALAPLHNNKTVIILPRFEREDSSKSHASTPAAVGDNDATIQEKYRAILQQSQFAAVPRGDYLYTYRLVEVLSAGAIPVILADDWVLPFHNSVVDWTQMAVILPESRAPFVLDYLSLANITAAQQCRMRQLGYHYYQTYMQTPQGVIQGFIESLEHLRRQRRQDEQQQRLQQQQY
jgi:Exostosin family